VEYQNRLFTGKVIDPASGVCLYQKIVSYSSFKVTVAKQGPCQRNNFSIKGNVANDIRTKNVALYINFVLKYWRYFKQ
jgi:hypothetical protein